MKELVVLALLLLLTGLKWAVKPASSLVSIIAKGRRAFCRFESSKDGVRTHILIELLDDQS